MRPAMVVDLDGTLITVNSFTRFVGWLSRRLLAKGEILKAARVAWIVALRKARRISHAEAKTAIMAVAYSTFKADDFEEFAYTLRHFVRPAVIALVTDHKAFGGVVILATAAPQAYAAPLAGLVRTHAVVATNAGNSPECKGDEKLRRVLRKCRQLDATVTAVVTDHYDDLPLLQLPDIKRIVVAPSDSTLRKLDSTGLEYSKIL